MTYFRTRFAPLLLMIFAVPLILTGCTSGGDQTLTVYSGRSKPLVDGLVEQYQQQSNITVNVKYGKDAQLLAALNEEGNQTPADVFWANTTGALSNSVDNDLLNRLPDSILNRANRFVPSNNRWVPVTTRFRVLAYNSNRVNPDELPDSVLDLPQKSNLEGRIGWTPTYSSFQDFMTVLRLTEGKDVARNWVRDMSDLNPKSYTSNTPMIQALKAGEIDVALTNHYYVLRLKHGGAEGEYEGHEEEEGEEHEEEHEESKPDPDAPVKTYHFAQGDPGNLALVTGAGVISATQQEGPARNFLEFLLSKQAQSFAAEQVNEYPVVAGVDVPEYMTPVQDALQLSPDFEPGRLSELEATLDLLREEGVL
ncbi:MAG: extracellular solute-binding protein [bacterium]